MPGPTTQDSVTALRRGTDGVSLHRRAVELRLAGHTLQQITEQTGLSAPTVIRSYRAFLSHGWAGLSSRGRGRRVGEGRALTSQQEQELVEALSAQAPEACGCVDRLWTLPGVDAFAKTRFDRAPGARALERLLGRAGLHGPHMAELAARNPVLASWRQANLATLSRQAARSGSAVVWVGQSSLIGHAGPRRLLVAQTLRGSLAWLPLAAERAYRIGAYTDFLDLLAATWPDHRHVLLHGIDVGHPALRQWLEQRPAYRLVACPAGPTLAAPVAASARDPDAPTRSPPPSIPARTSPPMRLTHLQRLEAESIHILREVVAECERPVMLYSIGKDSATMLHLAKKAFHPAPPPFPLLHVDTTWKFRDMYAMRERMAREMGMDLLVWQNPEAKAMGINPFDHGSQIHTDMWKTQGLKQALDHYGFDAAFGGARRDEEKSRAKERIFSFRSEHHRWDPKNQRPELWNLYNARKRPGESIRVFPLSNWTELDIWQYIYLEDIPIVPLYYARERPVVERNGTLLMVDDERFRLEPDEVPVMRKVRFRTLGCYPLSGAIESEADTLPAIIQEMLLARTSERQGRMIDHDQAASMEKKKQEGYF
jgi:sulfate adenylyltransferase subunit 2